jgi:hypothetical protein
LLGIGARGRGHGSSPLRAAKAIAALEAQFKSTMP